jgi:hypothetical protein
MFRYLNGVYILFLGCSLQDFGRFERNPPALSVKAPQAYIFGGFGARVTAIPKQGDSDLIAVSGARSTPVYLFFSPPDRKEFNPDAIFDIYCDDEPCIKGYGEVILGIPYWGKEKECIVIGGPESEGGIDIFCQEESKPTPYHDQRRPKEGNTRAFGSKISFFETSTKVAHLVVGAPLSKRCKDLLSGRCQGAAFLISASGLYLSLEPEDEEILDEARYGEAVASGILQEDTVLIAIGAPGMKRVYLYTYDKEIKYLGCIKNSELDEFGSELLVFDFMKEDGVSDLIVASAAREPHLTKDKEWIYIYSGKKLLALDKEEGCVKLDTDGDIEGPGRAGFGRAIWSGDLDQDTKKELIIAAPYATVSKKPQAGMVYIYRHNDLNQSSFVHDSTPKAYAFFGLGITVSKIMGKEELVVGSPGTEEFFIFFCTGAGEKETYKPHRPQCREKK